MSYYKETLEEELKRNLDSQEVFGKKYLQSKKGSLCVKKINEKEYIYLKYRDKERVVTEYIGPVHTVDDSQIKKELNKSKYYKRTLTELRMLEKKLRKAIKVL